MSVSRRAAAAAARALGRDPVLGRGQRALALRRVVLDLRQLDRQLLVGHRDDPALVAVDDRDRRPPVALARDQPVAQAVVDRRLAAALGLEPGDDLLVGLAVVLAVEAAGVDHRRRRRGTAGPRSSRAASGSLALDHPLHRQLELLGEFVVAAVVAGHRHDRPGPVLHQHVVGDEHRDLLAVDRVDDAAPERHAGLLAVLRPALLGRLAADPVDVLAHLRLGRRAGDQPLQLGVLGREDEEGGAEEGVGTGGEDREVEVDLLAAEDDLGALGAADPVALHRDHVLGPGLEQRRSRRAGGRRTR